MNPIAARAAAGLARRARTPGWWWLLLLCWVALLAARAELAVPALTGRVVGQPGLLDAERRAAIESRLAAFEAQAGLLAERAIEIVADRGIDARIGASEWKALVDALKIDLRAGRFEPGLLAAGQARQNELLDRPLVI